VKSSDLSDEQLAKLYEQCGRCLRWANHLVERMDRRGFAVDDRMRKAALAAQDGLHRLSVEIHYTRCRHGVGRDEE
jgi:hypothetical protein